MEGFTKIRTGIVYHLNDGRMSPFDLGIYTFLLIRADWKTGITKTCAASIAYVGRRVHSLAKPTRLILRVLENPLFWLGFLVLIALVHAARRRAPELQPAATDQS